mmetsp:Transcript_3773/g.10748  ORF Transcript_3773/g.10748 Transcript_3773/m.10748 type:complete len:98 (-) Transcript_3773:3342-3635(-)|eukprot:CAMPEP_0172368478 /NCGR_PEP_ID=MMETSP1060-20121228/27407_1 /TAXON_ID=37318 /ORGANISM="Pseudo-nitzschia pungens, Strain cf. cingulata" /LENGTH=97 /DNA_ID=CAMNT_0013093083 /DNA_START=228 /DNA_END=521 /DNA_ORIENTATION=+
MKSSPNATTSCLARLPSAHLYSLPEHDYEQSSPLCQSQFHSNRFLPKYVFQYTTSVVPSSHATHSTVDIIDMALRVVSVEDGSEDSFLPPPTTNKRQ